MNHFTHSIAMSLLLFTMVLESRAQVSIQGCVKEYGTNKALPYVTIQEVKSNRGDVTDENGCFELQIDQLPSELEFHLIGYEIKRIQITDNKRVVVSMKASDIMLDEVSIKANAFQRLAGNEKRSVWDYAWFGNNLLLCEYGNTLSKSRLILMSISGDTISQIDIPGRPNGMFNDCAGSAYIMSRDSLWEIYQDSLSINLYPAESAALVERVLQYCVGENDQSIFFAIPGGKKFRVGADDMAFNYLSNNDRMNYYLFNRKSDEMILFNSVNDEFTQKLKADEISYGNGPQPKKFTESAYSSAASKIFFYIIICKEIDAPMYYVDDSLYILDHTAGLLKSYNGEGKCKNQVPINYYLDPAYHRISLSDETHENLYVLFERNGKVTLHLINLQNGELIDHYSIPHLYPEHITVREHYIYYLCRDEKKRDARVLNRISLK